MDKRKLGHSDVAIAPLVLGGNVFGWSADEAASFEVLDAFVGEGLGCIDTADTYSAWVPGNRGGESETIIGRWLKQSGKRDQVVIATKVAKWSQRKGLSPANIAAAADDSLRRLGIERIDVYFAHEDDPSVPLEDTLGAFARLIEAGKVRTIGASNYSARTARRGAGGQREAWTAALRGAAAGIQPRLAQGLRRRARAARAPRANRRYLLLRAGERIPYRQVSRRTRSRQERSARRRRREIPQSARQAHPRRA